MQITIETINQFSFAAMNYMKRMDKAENKLTYAIKKITQQFASVLKKHDEKKGDINIDHAAVDAKEYLIFNEQGAYTYSKESQKARMAALRKLDETELYDIEPYYATKVPNDLTEFEKEKFAGFILEEPKSTTLVKSKSKSSL